MQLTLFGRQVDVMLRNRLESVDTAETDLATLHENKKDHNQSTKNQSNSNSETPKAPLSVEQEDMLMRQHDESTTHPNKKSQLEPKDNTHELFRAHEKQIMHSQKHQCNILRQGLQRIEKKMDSVTGALTKVHKSILTLSQGMMTLARQTAAMNAELVKTNHQIASTFQRLIQLKELELSKNTSSHPSAPTQPSNSNSSVLPRKSRARGGRRFVT
ncbi:uncharacterized protein PAF06_005140 [Gastrophryne carolinensis]